MIKKTEDGLSLFTEKGKRIITLEDLKDLHWIDKDLWEVIRQTANVWEVAMNKKDGTTEVIQLHQVKADFKPISLLVQDDIKKILLSHFNNNIPTIQSKEHKDWPLLANINLADLHIGRVEQKKPDQYERDIKDRIYDLFNKLLKDKPDKLILWSLGDQANSEFNWFTSSGKNRQDNWMTAKEMFERVLGIHFDLAKTFGNEIATELIVIPWNHDRSLMQNVGTALEIGLSKSNIKVDNEDKPRKYRKWWNTNLAFSHWDGEKEKQRLSIMSQEFGLNKDNERTIWHFHERSVKQYWPLEVETLASPAVQSDREKNQFAHKTAKFVGKLYDKKKGKIKTLFS